MTGMIDEADGRMAAEAASGAVGQAAERGAEGLESLGGGDTLDDPEKGLR